MTGELLNTELLPGNVCFGCGQENPMGLRIAVFRDPADPMRIFGEFDPQAHMIGFPGITHGGAIYTALDCMATWCGMAATMKYHRPAFQGRPISLSATIEKDDDEWKAIEVRAEARDSEGSLLAEGIFKVIPVPPEKFKAISGIDEIPENWAKWLGEHGAMASHSGGG